MIYLICFCVTMILLLVIALYGRTVGINLSMLVISVAVGCGGYFALSLSKGLEEALLANKLVYVTAAFAPMCVFLIICDICRVKVPAVLNMAMHTLQVVIFMSACTMGYMDIFYRSAEYHIGPAGAYITREYGPMHTLHLTMLFIYTLAGIAVGLYSLNRKNVVSRINVLSLLFADAMTVGIYVVERTLHLDVELMSVVFTIGAVVFTVILIKINRFSTDNNRLILDEVLKDTGYIFFDKRMRYMGCSEQAAVFFPELSEWELEKKVPGNGGRFNTFLRQPFLAYMKKEEGSTGRGAYEYKEKTFRYEIDELHSGSGRIAGYAIRILNVTDVIGTGDGHAEENGQR